MSGRVTLLIGLVSVFLVLPQQTSAWTLDEWGNVFLEQVGVVLGEGSDSGSSDNTESRLQEQKAERRIEERLDGDRKLIEEKPDERYIEIRASDEERTTFRERPGELRFETIQDGKRLRFERKDGETRLKLERKTGETEELPLLQRKEQIEKKEEELLRIRERADKKELRILDRNNQFVIARDRTETTSTFPLSVDTETNELIVTTPKGEKRVTVLPDQAIKNLLEQNIVDDTPGQTFELLETTDGSIGYKIEGTKRKKIFGFIPTQILKKTVVSAETGEVLETQSSLTDRILDLVSF